jgi:uncharacterized protein YdhG (YjbR/CyaY superfamily)
MPDKPSTPEQYIEELPDDRKQAIIKLRKTILDNLPEGFTETIGYGMIAYVVPHSIYPNGYHCDPSLPLPFINIASQKNHIAIYHMGLYADKNIMDWFVNEYPNHSKAKLDMGNSCIRFKKPDQIPYDLIGELSSRINPTEWIRIFETAFKK